MKIDAALLRNILKNGKPPGYPSDPSYQKTCVFLLLYENDGPCILAIQKTDSKGYPWRNQVALPGGHIDKTDSGPRDAAFRELEEELNIPGDQVEFIGSMGHFQTINNKDIQVFIGIWHGKGPVTLDSEEISRTLEIPLSVIIRTHVKKNFCGRVPGIPELEYPVSDVVVWGVTARILHHFLELLHSFAPDYFKL